MSNYRGVITALGSKEMKGFAEYLAWLNKQFKAGRKVIVLGDAADPNYASEDFTQKEHIKKIFRNLGLEYIGNFTANQTNIRYVHKDKEGVGFERESQISTFILRV
jgi:hypothetical protein